MAGIGASRSWPLSIALLFSVTGTAGLCYRAGTLYEYGALVLGREVASTPLERVKLWFSVQRTQARPRTTAKP